ncbi:MAG: hypothetical protein AAF358_25580 [Pseudomonadota bacterium]
MALHQAADSGRSGCKQRNVTRLTDGMGLKTENSSMVKKHQLEAAMNLQAEKKTHWIHSIGMAVGLAALLATQIVTAWAISSWLIH